MCAGGRYYDDTGADNCKACPAGTFLADDGYDSQKHNHVDDCKTCVKTGTYSDAGASSCKNCPAGYQALLTSSCVECPLGKANNVENGECKLCSNFQFQDEFGKASCDTCDAGKEATADRTDCEECDTGKFRSSSSPLACKVCPAGKFANLKGATACASPQPGYCLPDATREVESYTDPKHWSYYGEWMYYAISNTYCTCRNSVDCGLCNPENSYWDGTLKKRVYQTSTSDNC